MTQIATVNLTSGPPSAEVSLTRGNANPTTIVNPPAVVVALTRQVGDGPTGPRGTSSGGAAGAAFTFTQNEATTTWVINHGLGRHPSVTVVDFQGELMLTTFRYLSQNLVEVTFDFPTSGVAYLN